MGGNWGCITVFGVVMIVVDYCDIDMVKRLFMLLRLDYKTWRNR